MEYFKLIDTQQIKLINNYKNAKYKLLKFNAAVCFNKICRNSQSTTIYVNIKKCIVFLVCVIKVVFDNMRMQGMEYFKTEKVLTVSE
jgi:hypothetical protein